MEQLEGTDIQESCRHQDGINAPQDVVSVSEDLKDSSEVFPENTSTMEDGEEKESHNTLPNQSISQEESVDHSVNPSEEDGPNVEICSTPRGEEQRTSFPDTENPTIFPSSPSRNRLGKRLMHVPSSPTMRRSGR